MFWISVVVSAFILVIANFSAFASKKLTGACAWSVVGAISSAACIFLPASVVGSILMAFLALLCWPYKARPRWFLIGSCSAMIASHLFFAGLVISRLRQQDRIAQQYPMISVANRLAYEERSSESKHRLPTSTSLLASSATKDLEERVDLLAEKARWRRFNLARLHEKTVEDFVKSPGFGIARGIPGGIEYIELPESDPITQPAPMPEAVTSEGSSHLAAEPPPDNPEAPNADAIKEMHISGVVDFVNPEGFGYIQDRDHVRGFQAHQFRSMPEPEAKSSARRWQVQRLELLSLLKHETPVAYVSEHLPRMDELREAPTRPLDGFERSALDALRAGDDLRTGYGRDRIRILGAIRAVKQCTDCHDAKRGDLLGAFSYVLVPSKP